MFQRQTMFTKRIFFFTTRHPGSWSRTKNLQICFDSRRYCQPFQRSWAFELERVCWSCERFSKNLPTRPFEMAPVTSGWPWPWVYGHCHQRNGGKQNCYSARAHWNSPGPGHCWKIQPHPGWTPVRASVCRRNAPARGTAVHCLGQKIAWRLFLLWIMKSPVLSGKNPLKPSKKKLCIANLQPLI